MGIYFLQHDFGCVLEDARNINAAAASVRRDLGLRAGTIRARKATAEDIEWVRAMGGYIPKPASAARREQNKT